MDLSTAQTSCLESGDLLPAIKACMIIAGFFTPVFMNGHVVDSGKLNPVPNEPFRADLNSASLAIQHSGR